MNATKQDINRFAVKWLKKYQDIDTLGSELEELFPRDCFALGFTMDCGNSFTARYGNDAFRGAIELQGMIDTVDDIELLASAIFSHWRYYTHWTCSPIDREWFVVALSRLKVLTE
ncbi:hypothetical protein AALA61_14915 [Oscillospiraceae bacterium 42-9]